MLNKYTIIGLIAGGIISGLGVMSMVDFLANPIDVMNFDDGFGIGESTTFVFQAPENSLQKIINASRFIVEWLLWLHPWEGKQRRLEHLKLVMT